MSLLNRKRNARLAPTQDVETVAELEAENERKRAAQVAAVRMRRRRSMKELGTGLLITGGIFGFCVGLSVLGASSVQQARSSGLEQMTVQTGIVNGQRYDLVLASSLNVDLELQGTVFLFGGSITGETQEKLRMGYVAPNGNSYIISVPIDKVIFHQTNGATHGAKFLFKSWSPDLTLQENIDHGGLGGARLTSITIDISPEEFQQLIG